MTENSDLVKLVINSMKKDLDDFHETFNCLSLCGIANLGGREVAESLSLDVFRLLVSGNSPNFVKKKAALCLLRLYRKHPDVMPVSEWADKIISILEDFDMGVTTSVLSLITAMAQAQPELMASCVPKAVYRLHKVVLEKEYTPDYLYYFVPVPWLQVKILRLLQIYPAPQDRAVRDKLNLCLQAIFNNSNEVPKNVQQNNAMNAVLLEALNLVIQIDSDSDLVVQAAGLLCRYLSSKETNMRYLGLETLSQLASFPQCLDIIKKNQDTIFLSLKDKDVSVRRRALDLLYSMCDNSNAKAIVTELLQQLQVADYAMKEEMVLKIAILTEKFASEPTWYVDVMFKLIAIAGEHVSQEVWYRVIQSVTNDEGMHLYASRQVFQYLKSPSANEILVKVGGYILGEYGDLIVNDPGCSPIDQFNALQNKYGICSASTRAVLLTTYGKFINIFPEIKRECLSVLQQHTNVLDCELQQRACEYIALATLPSEELLQEVFEQLPPFPVRESVLLQRLKRNALESEDNRALAKLEALQSSSQNRSASVAQSGFGNEGSSAHKPPASTLDDLLGLNDASVSVAPKEKIEAWYRSLVVAQSGVLYEDSEVQIGVKMEYQGFSGKLALYFGNKSNQNFNNFRVVIQPAQGVQVAMVSAPLSSIGAKSQVVQGYQVACLAPFSGFTYATVIYNGNSERTIPELKLPLVGPKFSEPAVMRGDDFIAKWKQIGGGPKESQEIFKVDDFTSAQDLKTILQSMNVGIIEGVDSNPANIVGATILNTQSSGKVGNLIRIETNAQQQVRFFDTYTNYS
jgi:AP-2 complex subunit alpha